MNEPQFTIQIDKTIPEKVETVTYDRAFIEQQIISITEQRDEELAAREAELAECQAILKEMDKAGIISKTTFIAEQAEKVVSDGLTETIIK